MYHGLLGNLNLMKNGPLPCIHAVTTSLTSPTNNTLRKLRVSALKQYQGLGVPDRVFITKY